jgi:uncharacterized Fe-S center protein
MGEPGNRHYIKPQLIKPIVDVLRSAGCSPFVFDTPVVYKSPRNNVADYLRTAGEHGYTEHFLNAPVVISDRSVPVEGRSMMFEPVLDAIEADGVLLVSHFKGHIASGMGGAIKNVGMGCMSKRTKGAIHTNGEPHYTHGCTECMTCVEQCPTDNIRLDGGGPKFDRTWCPGCSNCVVVCPEQCIEPRVGRFDDLLAEAAVIAHSRFKKVYAINVLKGITRLCDCIADSGPVLIDDIGYICGPDMLSVDIASLETVAQASGKADIFAQHNKRSSWEHVRAAARLMERDLDVTIRER